MAQDFNRKRETARLRERIGQIKEQIEREQDYLAFGATHDHEYRMADARIDSLKVEREKLKEILGDLA